MFEIGYKKFMDILQAASSLGETMNKFSQEGTDLIISSRLSRTIVQKVVTSDFEPFCIDTEAPLRVMRMSDKETGKVKAVMKGDEIWFFYELMKAKAKKSEEIVELEEQQGEIFFKAELSGEELDILSKRLKIGESMKIGSTDNVFLTSSNDELNLLGTDGYISYRGTVPGEVFNPFLFYFKKEDFKPFRLFIKNLPKTLVKKKYNLTVRGTHLYIDSGQISIAIKHSSFENSNQSLIYIYSMSSLFTKELTSWTKIDIEEKEFQDLKEIVKGTTRKDELDKDEEKMFSIEKNNLKILDEKEQLELSSFKIETNKLKIQKNSLVGVFKHLKEMLNNDELEPNFYIKHLETDHLILFRRVVEGGSYLSVLASR